MGEGGGGEEKVSFLHLSSFFASIFPLFPRNAWYSGYTGIYCKLVLVHRRDWKWACLGCKANALASLTDGRELLGWCKDFFFQHNFCRQRSIGSLSNHDGDSYENVTKGVISSNDCIEVQTKKKSLSYVHVLHKTWNFSFSRRSRATKAKKCTKSVLYVQSFCFANRTNCCVPVIVS